VVLRGAVLRGADNWRLLRPLAQVARLRLFLLAAVMLLRSTAPVGASLATMLVVSRLPGSGVRRTGGLLLPIGALAGCLLIAQLSQLLMEPVQFAVRREIDGRHRREVGRTALAGDLARLEDPVVRDDLLLAAADPANWTERTPGAAACGQLLRVTKWVGALCAAGVVGRHSLPVAVGLLVVLAAQNSLMCRQWYRMAQVWAGGAGHLRRAAYLTGVTTDAPSAKEVRLYGFAPWMIGRYRESVEEHLRPYRKAKLSLVRKQWFPFAAISVAMAWTLDSLARTAQSGHLDAAALSAAAVAAWSLFSIGASSAEILDVEGGKVPAAALDRVRADAPPAPATPVASPTGARSRPPEIRFQDVTFSYPGHTREVLRGLDLCLAPGETLAIVGLNGAGKSTLIKLLAGLYRPTSGSISADGVDLGPLSANDWYRNVAVVFQDFIHYGMSLKDNIAIGASRQDLTGDVLDAVWRRAAADMGLADIAARLPDGWDTPVSASVPGGVDLSGGQWQRVALARALCAMHAGARVLVLDEPTAHLDVRTEWELFHSLLKVTTGLSTVIVSHRLSTVRSADRIVLLEDGRIVENGSHSELMALRGHYHDLFQMQAERFTDDGEPTVREGSLA
jgi:ABC-type multidrug transport system fused ATPase/permease subunit